MTNPTLVAVTVMSLEKFPNDELAAFNLAASFTGHLPRENTAHARAVRCSLAKEDGSLPAIEELRQALAYEINRRTKAGTFTFGTETTRTQ